MVFQEGEEGDEEEPGKRMKAEEDEKTKERGGTKLNTVFFSQVI